MSFIKGNDPYKSTGLGKYHYEKEARKWFENNNKSTAKYTSRIDQDVITVEIEGNLVLNSHPNVNDVIAYHGTVNHEVSGKTSILSEISLEEAHNNVVDRYKEIIDKCSGKSLKEQQEIIFGTEDGGNSLKEGDVEQAEDYISILEKFSSESQAKDLATNMNTCIEAALDSRDENGISLREYKKILERK